MCLLSTVILMVAGCGPYKGNEQESKDFLDEIHFVDKDSLKVIDFDLDDRGVYSLIFQTAKVDFDALREFDTMRPMPSENHIAYIEKISKYRFKTPANEFFFIQDVPVRNYGQKKMFKIIKDGDDYIVHCMFRRKGTQPTEKNAQPAAPTTQK